MLRMSIRVSGCALPQLGRDLQARLAGHRDVEHHHVGRQLERQRERLGAVRGLAHDREAGLALQHVADAGPHDGVIVGDQDPDGGVAHVTPGRVDGHQHLERGAALRAPPKRTLPPSALIRSRMPARPMCPSRSSRRAPRPAGPGRRPAPRRRTPPRSIDERHLDARVRRRAAARWRAPPAARGTGPAPPPSRGRAAPAGRRTRSGCRCGRRSRPPASAAPAAGRGRRAATAGDRW